MATENKNTETKKTEEKKPAVVVPNFYQKVKIGKEFKHGNVTLREYATLKENDLEGALVLLGFPDGGLTSSIVSHYIVKKLNLPIIGDFSSKLFPPLLTVKHGQPATGARIYGNKLLVVVVSEYRIDVPELQHELIEAVIAFTKRNKCKLVLTVDSVSEDPTQEHELLDSLEVENVLGEDGEGGDDDDYGAEEGGFDEEYEALELPATTLSGALPGAPSKVKIPTKLAAQAAITKSASKSKAKKESEEEEKPKKEKKSSTKKGHKKEEEENEEDEEDISKYEEKIYFLTSNQKVGETLAAQKALPIVEYASKSISAGLVLQVTFDEEVDCCVLLAPMDKLGVGTRGAIAILNCLNCLFKGDGEGVSQAIAIDTEELNGAAQGLEKKVKELMAKVQQPSKDEKHMLDRIYM